MGHESIAVVQLVPTYSVATSDSFILGFITAHLGGQGRLTPSAFSLLLRESRWSIVMDIAWSLGFILLPST